MRRLARVMRLAIVASGTRSALAISVVVRPPTVRLVIRTGMDADQRTGLVVERLAQALLYTSDDKREGAEAFLAKRPSQFTGS